MFTIFVQFHVKFSNELSQYTFDEIHQYHELLIEFITSNVIIPSRMAIFITL